MGGGKGSSTSRSSSNSSSSTTYNVDNSITTGDFGAISGAVEISKEALQLGSDAVESSERLAGRGIDLAGDVTRDTFDFSSDAIARIADFAEAGNRTFVESAAGLVDKSLRSIGELALQTSASTDDRVTKVATYAFLAAAAAVVLPAVFNKR